MACDDGKKKKKRKVALGGTLGITDVAKVPH